MTNTTEKTITVYGAGLAGCEAAWQAAKEGVQVRLVEMKPEKYTPAHHAPGFAELVCSNSLRSDSVSNAVGLLKEEHSLDHYAEVIVTIMKGVAFDWCLSGAAFDMHDRIDETMMPYLKSIMKD